jgi:DNA-binding NarL/FixJ family response regulator
MTRVYIVEDDEVTRRALCERMQAHADLQVDVAVGTCAAIRESLALGRPDVLLVDLGLPDGNGIDVIAEAAAQHAGLPIMVITVFGDERRVVAAIKAGATGYLLKDDQTHEIGAAIRQLREGGSPISAAIARHLIRHFQPQQEQAAERQASRLTTRENEVLALAAKGFSYGEIAQILDLSVNTVASYTKNIYEKLAVRSRSEAIYEASRLGLINRD